MLEYGVGSYVQLCMESDHQLTGILVRNKAQGTKGGDRYGLWTLTRNVKYRSSIHLACNLFVLYLCYANIELDLLNEQTDVLLGICKSKLSEWGLA